MKTHRRFKEELYGELARVGAALASPKRLEILDLLAQRERSVEDVAAELELSTANASQHLRALLDARLVKLRRNGHFAWYAAAGTDVLRLAVALREVAEARLAEVGAVAARYMAPRDRVGTGEGDDEEEDPRALLRAVEHERILLLDVRPVEEYRAGHLPGARALPLERLRKKTRIAGLRRSMEIIAYCRGPYCVFADEAVGILRERGFRARRLRLGPADWRARGWPVIAGESA